MQAKIIKVGGLGFTIAYAAFIVWIYATEPRNFKEVTTSAEIAAGTYAIDQEKFNSALALFRREQFRAARDEWQRADPAQRDARTEFYIAYSFYRGLGPGVFRPGVVQTGSRGSKSSNRAVVNRPLDDRR